MPATVSMRHAIPNTTVAASSAMTRLLGVTYCIPSRTAVPTIVPMATIRSIKAPARCFQPKPGVEAGGEAVEMRSFMLAAVGPGRTRTTPQAARPAKHDCAGGRQGATPGSSRPGAEDEKESPSLFLRSPTAAA